MTQKIEQENKKSQKTKKEGTIKEKKTIKTKSKQNTNIIKDAPNEKFFILSNGEQVKNPKELADILEHINDEVFYHHVTNDRNDFSTWIYDIFKDTELATELAGTKNKDHTRIALYKHIVKKLTQ